MSAESNTPSVPFSDKPELHEKLAQIGCQLISIPPPTGDEKLRLEGWRNGIEKYGQELWTIYHWIVWAQDGNTHGIYRLREWLESFNVPDNTGGAHWPTDIPGWER